MSQHYRLTAILAVILFGIGSYVYFVDVPASEQATHVKKEEQKLIPFDDRGLTQVSLKTPHEHLVFDRDERGRWIITTPLAAPADSREVRKVLRALTLAKIERVIQEDATDLAQYGLGPARMTVTLSNGTQTLSLDLGNPGPFSSSLYVRHGKEKRVILTTLNVLTFAKKTLHTYRLKDVLFFNHAKVQHLELLSPNQHIELDRVPGVHGVSPNWRFLKPLKGPADKTTVGILLMALEDLQAEDFVDSEQEKVTLLSKLGEPTASARIKTARNTHAISFYQHKDMTYAKTSADKPLYLINSQIVKEVTKELFGLRDKRLLGIPTDELTIVRVKTPQGTYSLINQNNMWVLEEDPGTPLDQKIAKLLVSRLADLPAEHRVTEDETTLSTYGLDSPALTITAVDQRGQERGRLLVGKADRGLANSIGSGLPGIYKVRSTILTQIPSKQELIDEANE